MAASTRSEAQKIFLSDVAFFTVSVFNLDLTVIQRTVLRRGAWHRLQDRTVFCAGRIRLPFVGLDTERLTKTARLLVEDFAADVHIYPADLFVPGAVSGLAEHARPEGMTVDSLVNNAGVGICGRLQGRTTNAFTGFWNRLLAACVRFTPRALVRRAVWMARRDA